MTKISTSEFDIQRAYSTLQHNMSEFDSFAHSAAAEIDSCKNYANSVLSGLQSKLSSGKSKLEYLQNRAENLRSTISRKQAELAACRPPRTVTVTYTDSDGNTHSYTYVEDPDKAKREALIAEISALSKELERVNQAIKEFIKYIQELQKGIDICKSAYPSIESATSELNTCISQVNNQNDAMVETVRKAEEAINSYNSVDVHGSSESSIMAIPFFQYQKGFMTSTLLSNGKQQNQGRGVVGNNPAKGPIEIIFSQEVKAVDEFIKAIEEIINVNRCAIILKIHKSLRNFKYPTNLAAITRDLTMLGFKQRKTNFGTNYVTVDGYYVYDRS